MLARYGWNDSFDKWNKYNPSWKKWCSRHKKPLAKSQNISKTKRDKIPLSANRAYMSEGETALKSVFCGPPNKWSKLSTYLLFFKTGSTMATFDWIFQFLQLKVP